VTARRLTAALPALLLAAGVLAGCGQKGPLYHPGDEQAARQYDPADAYTPDDETQAPDAAPDSGASSEHSGT